MVSNFREKFIDSSVNHPQSNGQAEVANILSLTALKKNMDELKGGWVDMVPVVP